MLTPEDWETQETIVKLADGSSTRYGLGVSLGERGGAKVVTHGGEAVGFLSTNVVIPEKRYAVVSLVNADFGGAHDAIADGITDLLLPEAKKPVVPTLDQVRDELAKKLFAQLQTGRLDRGLLTENANYYFTDTATEDYHDSLAPLGEPESFSMIGRPRLRGGFVNRNYLIVFKDQKMIAITYSEPGAEGKFEQFILQPRD